jgi:C4-dicarboxylate transporter
MTVMLVIIGVIVAFMIALFFWSRWADREAAYEPEQLSEEEASIYRLGIALGANQPGMPGQ